MLLLLLLLPPLLLLLPAEHLPHWQAQLPVG
jgi:hypothetical protein